MGCDDIFDLFLKCVERFLQPDLIWQIESDKAHVMIGKK